MDASLPTSLDGHDREGAVSVVEDYAGQYKGYKHIPGGRGSLPMDDPVPERTERRHGRDHAVHVGHEAEIVEPES